MRSRIEPSLQRKRDRELDELNVYRWCINLTLRQREHEGPTSLSKLRLPAHVLVPDERTYHGDGRHNDDHPARKHMRASIILEPAEAEKLVE